MDKRTALHDALVETRDAILAVCDEMDERKRRAPAADGHWSVQDLIGHLAFWEGTTLDHVAQTFKEGRPHPMPLDGLDDDLNRREVAKRKDWSWQRVRAEFVNTRNALIERVAGMSETDLQFQIPSPWTSDTRIISIETLIREDVLEHGAEHFAEIQHHAHDHH